MAFDFATPTPLAEAVKEISGRTPIGSILRTREWAGMPLALRQEADFSAGVENVRVMQRIHDGLLELVSNARGEATGRRAGTGEPGVFKMDRKKFIADIRDLAISEGLIPVDDALEGTLQDITSEARLDLIVRTRMEMAQGRAFHKRGQQKNILNAWPAKELIRIEARLKPRDWPTRWEEAGGELRDGRMVALKNDPIWIRISRFGQPYPPYDFNSGMGDREIDREEALSLGLLEADQELEPEDEQTRLEASVADLSDEFKGALKTIFGGQIDIDGDVVKWRKAA
jgi:hypothetical protein